MLSVVNDIRYIYIYIYITTLNMHSVVKFKTFNLIQMNLSLIHTNSNSIQLNFNLIEVKSN